MGQYFKALTILAAVIYFAAVSGGIIKAFADTDAAKEFKASCIAEIENSNFNDSVINACISEATSKGYTLAVNKTVVDPEYDVVIAEVVLEYPYEIVALGISNTHQTRGIAR